MLVLTDLPPILAEMTGSKTSEFSVMDEMLALTLGTFFFCKRG